MMMFRLFLRLTMIITVEAELIIAKIQYNARILLYVTYCLSGSLLLEISLTLYTNSSYETAY